MLNAGVYPLHESAVQLVRLLGGQGRAVEGENILYAMEELKMELASPWAVLIGGSG